MNTILTITNRELGTYFATPLALVFIVIFLVLNGVFTFQLGFFYERGQADLTPFFTFHPWLYLFLVSAIAMRTWAEERKSGTLELLLTLPITLWQAVAGKFLAGWIIIGASLLATFPIWITVNYLGDPDNGAILAGYLGSVLMAGAFLAIGCCVSAATSNQVIAFIGTVVIAFVFIIIGFPPVLQTFEGILPASAVDAIASLSFLEHFQNIARGVVVLADVVYFLALIVGWLTATCLVIELKKA